MLLLDDTREHWQLNTFQALLLAVLGLGWTHMDNTKLFELLDLMREQARMDGEHLKEAVLTEVLDNHGEEIEPFIKNVLVNGGCSGGSVGSLIYYEETFEFYKEHFEEIHELLDEYEETTGGQIKFKSPRYNWLAWFGFEETLRNIAHSDELNLDI